MATLILRNSKGSPLTFSEVDANFTNLNNELAGKATSGSIVNADIAANAAITYSKLSLSNGILNADINTSAGIAYSKLSLLNSVVNADIASGAAIAHSKLANLTAGQVLLGNGSNVPTGTALSGDVTINSSGVTAIGSGVIVDADVNASAAIAGTKISPNFGAQNAVATQYTAGTGAVTSVYGSQSIELGNGATAGVTTVDLKCDSTYTDYGTRLERASGANGLTYLRHRGTGELQIVAPESSFGAQFWIGGTERFRVTSGDVISYGSFKVNNNAFLGNSSGALAGFGNTTTGFAFENSSGSIFVSRASSGPTISANLNDDGSVFSARRSGNEVGTITVNSSATSYNTSSDYRLKENVVSLTSAISRLLQIPVHRFNFIVSPERTVDGFLAHEVSPVVPEAVTGEYNAVDADGNPVYQQIDQSKLVPLLTAALQEAIGRIETLEAQVAALTP